MTTESERLEHIEQSLSKIESSEKPFQKYILQIITIVFLAGGGWVTLDTLADGLEAAEQKTEALEDKEAESEKKIAVLEANQKHIKDKVDSIDRKIDQLIKAAEDDR